MDHVIEGVDYGPLAYLVGTWRGDKGTDVAPEPDGEEEISYYESMTFEAIGDVTNAESQTLAAVRYHQVVSRVSNDERLHNETGYWAWDAAQGLVMQTLTIPRGVCLVAGGSHEASDNAITIRVHASKSDANWPIVESPFMRDNASTIAFNRTITVDESRLNYEETTVVDIYGRRFDHTDGNTLIRVAN